jgi:hypothetical protein
MYPGNTNKSHFQEKLPCQPLPRCTRKHSQVFTLVDANAANPSILIINATVPDGTHIPSACLHRGCIPLWGWRRYPIRLCFDAQLLAPALGCRPAAVGASHQRISCCCAHKILSARIARLNCSASAALRSQKHHVLGYAESERIHRTRHTEGLGGLQIHIRRAMLAQKLESGAR